MEQPIVSIRNLERGRFSQPLKEFKGTFKGLSDEDVEHTEYNGKPGLRVHLKFSDVEVIESTEPYDFPIAELSLPYSKTADSIWGVLSDSMVLHIPDNKNITDLAGVRMHLKFTPGHMMWDGQKRTPRESWEVVGIEGKASATPKKSGLDRALEILNGKTTQQFNQAALSDPVVRADSEIQPLILGKKFIPQMIEMGAATVDKDGVHHVTVTS